MSRTFLKKFIFLLDSYKKEPEAMAVRIDTLDTLLLFKGRFRLSRSTQGEQIFISQNSIPSNFFNEIYIPALSVPKFANGREYIELNTNQKIFSYGAFLNVDRIFSDNQWCKFFIVDDLSEGYIFTRNDDKFFGFTNKECLPFTEYSIFSGERDYYSLIQTLKQ